MKFVAPIILKLACSLSGKAEGLGAGNCLSIVISCQLTGSRYGFIPVHTLTSISCTSLLLKKSERRKLLIGAIVIHNGNLVAIPAAGAVEKSSLVKEPDLKLSL